MQDLEPELDNETPLVQDKLTQNLQNTRRIIFLLAATFGLLAILALCAGLISGYMINFSPVKSIRIIHFSDFYQVQGVPLFPGDEELRLGGMSRLATIVKQQTEPYLLVFGGDLFFPSAMSSSFGQPDQMVDTFNAAGVHFAVAGNHEFDRGLAFAQSQFPRFSCTWLLSNFFKPNTTSTLDGVSSTNITIINGLKIGFMGLAFDYRESTSLGKDSVFYEDYTITGRRLAKQLRDQGCDLVIALIHMEWKNQPLLVEAVPEIDIILSGHDHFFRYSNLNNVEIVEGDINLEKVSFLDISFYPSTKPLLRTDKVTYIVPDDSIPKDPAMEEIVQKYVDKFNKAALQVIGRTTVDLDCLDQNVRTRETNTGDFVADLVNQWAINILKGKPYPPGVDSTTPVLTIVNGGALRWNRIKLAGNITLGDLLELSPFENDICLIVTTGNQLRQALENGVSRLPEPSGRFLQISGFRIEHSCPPSDTTQIQTGQCDRPVGDRILSAKLNNGTEISSNMTVILGISSFLVGGGDGFTQFLNDFQVVSSNDGPDLFALVKSFIQTNSPISPEVDGRISSLGRSFKP